MSDHINKSHNKTLFLYHLVFPAKYRRKVFSDEVENTLRDVCIGIGERYEIGFAEIGLEEDHVHFLVQGILEIVDMVKGTWVYKKLRNFRAGIEGMISFLKRCFGAGRCTWRGLVSFKSYVWGSVVSANLLILARHTME